MIKQRNILEFYKKLGGLLDQAQPEKMEKTNGDKKNNLLLRLNSIFRNNTQVYGITCTLGKKCDYNDPLFMHRMIVRKLCRSTLWRKQKYLLIPEFTDNGRLHYHGVIYNCYEVEAIRLSQWWKREFGFTKFEKEIRYPNKWIDYILKDIGKTGLWTISNMY